MKRPQDQTVNDIWLRKKPGTTSLPDYIEGVAKQTIIKMDNEVYVRSSEFEKDAVVRFVESIVFHSYDHYYKQGIVYAIKLRGS